MLSPVLKAGMHSLETFPVLVVTEFLSEMWRVFPGQCAAYTHLKVLQLTSLCISVIFTNCAYRDIKKGDLSSKVPERP